MDEETKILITAFIAIICVVGFSIGGSIVILNYQQQEDPDSSTLTLGIILIALAFIILSGVVSIFFWRAHAGNISI